MDAAEAEEEAAVRSAAAAVIDAYVRDGSTISLGTGAAIAFLLEDLAARLASGALKGVRVLAASEQTASEAALAGVPQARAADGPLCSLYVDVADELALDPSDESIAFVIGRSPGPQAPPTALARARQLAAEAATRVVIAESPAAMVPRLGGALPVVIQGGDAWEDPAEELDDLFLGDAEVWRRSTQPGAGPRGGDAPVVTPEGWNVLDIRFDGSLRLFGEEVPYAAIAEEIERVPGIVAHGLCVGLAAAAVVAQPGDTPRVLVSSTATACDH